MQEQIYNEAAAAIVFDAALSGQISPDWFAAAYWGRHDALSYLSGGRDGVAVIGTPAGECVLRHYHRGGLVARLMADRYVWQGASRTRSFAEFRLLEQVARLGLPGPTPIAARYVRQGLFYTADLITLRIAHARTLTELLAADELDGAMAARVGSVVARFHRAGIWHADLNAHNILLNPDGIHLIDFDRGRVRTPRAAWRNANLGRLRRSLLKLGAGCRGEGAFATRIWQPLLGGYARTWKA
ncbi:MAG: 3-deoxy-D-manno-octulosonic acid kinase [Rhodanobacter sp.]